MDLLFKIVHSNKKIPFIKYNPGRNRENIFRFYTNNYITDNNIKLPYLYVEDNKRYYKIQRIDHMLAPNNSLGFYIEFEDKLLPVLYCEFYPNGNINIRIDESSIGYDDLIMFFIICRLPMDADWGSERATRFWYLTFCSFLFWFRSIPIYTDWSGWIYNWHMNLITG